MLDSSKALKQSPAYKAWSSEVNAAYRERIDTLKEQLSEAYIEQLQAAQNIDYPIFMAIAEEIGYDATGKPTTTNDLDYISEELARFIEAIEQGRDAFFL